MIVEKLGAFAIAASDLIAEPDTCDLHLVNSELQRALSERYAEPVNAYILDPPYGFPIISICIELTYPPAPGDEYVDGNFAFLRVDLTPAEVQTIENAFDLMFADGGKTVC